jgi:hypothetical protein
MERKVLIRWPNILEAGSLVFVWAVLLMVYDGWLVFQRSGGSAGLSILPFAATGVGLIALLVMPVALLRQLLREAARPHLIARMAVGVSEGAFIAYLVCFAQKYETIGKTQRYLAAGALVLIAAAAFALAPRFPRISRLANVLMLIAALVIEWFLPMREYRMLHLALDYVAAAGLLGCLSPLVRERVPQRVQMIACVLLCCAAIAAPSLVRRSEQVRGLLYQMSTHARVHALPLRRFLKVKRDKGARMEFVICKGEYTHGCAGFVPNLPTTLAGSAQGADILMLTVDSMRWDHAHGMPLLKKELGPHVRFDRAVSTAPRTSHSFGSSLRGRPLRQTPFAVRAGHPGVAPNAPETFGKVLNRNGYRAIHAPTHSFLFPHTSLADGFEAIIDAKEFDPWKGIRYKSVPLLKTIAMTLEVAKQTPGPLFAWIHAMDTHSSYHWDGGKGPASPEGQLHAARDVDKKLARFVRDYRALRAGRKLIISVYGDHGEEFGEHGGTYHGSTTFAEQVRVMFWLAVPGVGAQVIDAPVSTAAVAATLLELVGVERPCTFTVPSLAACLERREACPSLAVSELVPFGRLSKDNILAGYTGPKYRMLYDRRQDILRFFDADNDPYEHFDLSRVATKELALAKQQARAWDEQFCVEPWIQAEGK